MGGWVESGGANHPAPLLDWMPPPDWGVSAHAKHLRNLYVYFWRWATWKVFDHDPSADRGIVCFITVAGFLNGPGFERMRDDLRRKADEIWIIDCSPEGHQPEVNTRIFQGVQQPVCIMLASRSARSTPDVPAAVRYRALPEGHRDGKFAALSALTLDAPGWRDCPSDWRSPFLPSAAGAWADFPALDRFFEYDGSGVMPGRTWVIAPDVESLERRWAALQRASEGEKERLFHPHQQRGGLGDRHVARLVTANLHGHAHRAVAVKDDDGAMAEAVRYGFRSFDRQWIIADNRLINRANPTLWEGHSDRQVYLMGLEAHSPSNGPALTFCAEIPDLDHYKGSFGGRAFPLWRDAACSRPNVPVGLLALLAQRLGRAVSGDDVMAYIAAVASHPAYTERFSRDLVRPGLRIPLTGDPALFAEAVELGRRVIWLQTYGERCADATAGRPAGAPRAEAGNAPVIPRAGRISSEPDAFPDHMEYDATARRLAVGTGFVDHVEPAVWAYTVSGKQVVKQWFSYRRKSRERPLIGDRRPPSPLGDIQPERWPHEYTTELVDLLNVLTLAVQLEPRQRELLERVCAGPLVSAVEVASAAGTPAGASPRGTRHDPTQIGLLD